MKYSFEFKTKVSPERIWDFYANIENWYKWEDNLQDITLDGDFVTGNKGVMTLKGQPPMNYELTEMSEYQSFCDKASIPGLGSIYFNHELIPSGPDTIIRHSVEFISESGNDFQEHLGFVSQVFSDVPNSVLSLVRAANE